MTEPPITTALPRRVLAELTPSEAEFQRRVIVLAHRYAWRVYHTHWSKHSERGFPDLCLVRGASPGGRAARLAFAELKVWPRLEPSLEQAAWLARLGAVPGVEAYLWAWVWPGTVMDEIAAILGRD